MIWLGKITDDRRFCGKDRGRDGGARRCCDARLGGAGSTNGRSATRPSAARSATSPRLRQRRSRPGNKLLLAGNGGSAGDAQHLAGEMLSRLNYDRAPAAAIALTRGCWSRSAFICWLGQQRKPTSQIRARPGGPRHSRPAGRDFDSGKQRSAASVNRPRGRAPGRAVAAKSVSRTARARRPISTSRPLRISIIQF
jgi:hypothetical protein